MSVLFFFHPSTYPTPRVTPGIQPRCLKVKVGYTLNKPPVLPQRDKQPSTLTSTDNLELPLGLMCMSLYCGWNQEYLEGSHSGTERSCQHTTQTHKYPRRVGYLCVYPNPQPPCYEATALSSAPLDGSDSNRLIMTAQSDSVHSNSWTYTDCSSKLFNWNWEVLFRFIYCPVFLVVVQV